MICEGAFPRFHFTEEFCASATEVVDDPGIRKTLECDERYNVPSEIAWLLKTAGFADIGIFGARLGAFSRADRLTTEDFEMLVTAKKTVQGGEG